jgi:hypothetical protein
MQPLERMPAALIVMLAAHMSGAKSGILVASPSVNRELGAQCLERSLTSSFWCQWDATTSDSKPQRILGVELLQLLPLPVAMLSEAKSRFLTRDLLELMYTI